MNPKDMTNEALLDAWIKEMKGDYEHGCPCETEVHHRLDEADALRKENAELRKHVNKIIDSFSDEALDDLCDIVMDAADWIGTHPARIESAKQKEASHE